MTLIGQCLHIGMQWRSALRRWFFRNSEIADIVISTARVSYAGEIERGQLNRLFRDWIYDKKRGVYRIKLQNTEAMVSLTLSEVLDIVATEKANTNESGSSNT